MSSISTLVVLGVLRSAPLRASLSATTTHAPEAPLRPPPKFRPHPFAYHEEVTVTIDDLSSLGDGVGRVQLAPDASDADGDDRGWVVMVPFTLPGETVRARVFRNHKGHSDADLLEVVGAPSAVRTEPRCALFGVCGGCQYQHVEYAEQLRMKARHVSELLARTGGLDGAAVRPTIGSPKELGYRSKLTPQYNVERRDGERPAVGFVQARTRSRMVDVARCEIATDGINAALPAAREKVAESVAAALAAERRGGKRALGGSVLLRDASEGVVTDHHAWVSEVRAAAPTASATACHLTTHRSPCTTHRSQVVPLADGDELRLKFQAGDFFQNNPFALPALVDYVVAQASAPLLPRGGETEGDAGEVRARHLIDAYCGSGLFALASAGRFEACAGVETCESAVRSARANAKANGIGNCGFVAASAEEIFGRLPAAFAGREAAVVMDPPRKGADLSFLRQLLRFAPRRVVYVSCGADTLARDLRLLVGAGYTLTEVQPFDLFPQTRHIETVATLDLAVDAPRQIDAPAEGTREPGRRKRKRQERRRRSTE